MQKISPPDWLYAVTCQVFLLACVLGLSLAPASAPAQLEEILLLENVHVIVGDGSELEAADVWLQGDSIMGVADSAPATLNPNRRIDLSGKTLMPALIDGHAHLGYQSRQGWGADFYDRDNLVANLKQYAFYGFAAVFSAGSDPEDLAQELQQQHEAGEFIGARPLFAAGMAPPGEGPNNQFLVHTGQLEQETGQIILRGLANPDVARQQVREVAAKGIGFIKIWVDDRGGSQNKLQPEIYRAVGAQAQSLGLRVFAHQQYASDMQDLVMAGVQGFLHGRIGAEFDSGLATLLALRDVFVVPNLGLAELRREAIGRDEFLASVLSPQDRARLSIGNQQRRAEPNYSVEQEAELRAGFSRLLNAEVDLVLGTDAGAVPDHPFGYTGHRELEIFVRLGVPPMLALQAATATAARHLNLGNTGQIREGYQADLLVLDANPLVDIRNTRRINSVYLRGVELDRASLLEDISRD